MYVPPKDQVLKDLHQAYREYMRTEPWQELTERNPFVTRHPDTSEDIWCLAMGHWQIEYGVALYVGENAESYYRTHALRADNDAPVTCELISAATGERNLVDFSERRRLSKMGISYGKDEWPIWFRVKTNSQGHRIGRTPVSNEEAKLLTEALSASVDIAEQTREDRMDVKTDNRPFPGDTPVPVIRSIRREDGTWEHSQPSVRN